MSHFKLIRTSEIYESPMHEDNGVSIGGLGTYLLSKTASQTLTKSRPAGKKFKANNWTNVKWFDKFIKHTGETPEEITFSRGLVHQNRWYVKAMYL